MSPKFTDNERIAVLETEMRGLREQHKAQSEETNRKLDLLFEALNRGKGAFTASIVLAGVIGGGVMKIISFIGR